MRFPHTCKTANVTPEAAGCVKQAVHSMITMALLLPMLVLMIAVSASAQVTGGISGTVVDSQGALIPGAGVILLSETKGTTVGSTTTNEVGLFLFPNVAPDRYTIRSRCRRSRL